MIMNRIKTALLLALLSGLLLGLGTLFGGMGGLHMAIIIALIMNVCAYFFSGALVLRLYKARPLDQEQYSSVYLTTQELSSKMAIPMPNLYIIQNRMANAFATGRNPSHACVAVTTGLLDLLEQHELRGVLAHELSHIKNRDILVATIAATIASAIGYLAHTARYIGLWGSLGNNRQKNNPIGLLFIALLMPLAAALVQLAISRSREYIADESGAHYSQDPLALASALSKLHDNLRTAHLKSDKRCASTASLFIVHPFLSQSWINLFSTHPPIEARIRRLHDIYQKNISL